MIDTHCHLFDEAFDEDRDEAIKRAKEVGVKKIMIVGFSKETNEKAYQLSLKDNIFYPTCGIHPDEADDNYLEKLKDLKTFLDNHKVYAIGECGLDYHWTKDNIDIQKILLHEQCKLALEYNLPIIIHMRDAQEDTYDILKQYKGLRGVMHCYSGSYEMALRFIDLGFYISLGGPVTFKNAKEPQKNATLLPLDRLLIETDCPYLAPVPQRGKRNETSFIHYTLEKIAELRNISVEEMDKITSDNAIKLFNI